MQAASNINEFNEQARAFVTKAKNKGLSNTAIANTINFMYGMYQSEQKNKITPAEQARLDLEREKWDYAKSQAEKGSWELRDVDGDGVMEWVDPATQQVKGTDFAGNESLAAQVYNQEGQQTTSGTGTLSGARMTGSQMQPTSQVSTTSPEAFLQPGQQGPMTQLQAQGVSLTENKKAKEDADRARLEAARTQLPGSSLTSLLTPTFQRSTKTQDQLAQEAESERKRLESIRSGSTMFPALPGARM